MDTALIFEYLYALRRELHEWRRAVFWGFVVVSFSVLIFGMVVPKSYETSTMLQVDVTNIIEPSSREASERALLEQGRQAKEMIYTRRIIEPVARETGIITPDDGFDKMETKIIELRKRISIEDDRLNFFRVVYVDSDQDLSFRVLNSLIDTFIKDSIDRKRAESRNAYEFINEQVKNYKRQLVLAEERLKEFKSNDLDGNEATVQARLDNLRLQIEELGIVIEELEEREKSISQQLQEEGAYLAAKNQIDILREQRSNLQLNLANFRLSYKESYPDIITLKEQIAGLDARIDSMEKGAGGRHGNNEKIENPLYEELRKRKSEVEAEIRSQRKRRDALSRLLVEEQKRSKRVAAKQADLSELVRDYNVTRSIYEEMLERKEKARLSMTLDIEGQGVSYRIQEPAVYPLKPSGLRTIHYAILGPMLGVLLPILALIAYIMLDSRIRVTSMLEQRLPEEYELLGVVPEMITPAVQRSRKMETRRTAVLFGLALLLYGFVALLRFAGVI